MTKTPKSIPRIAGNNFQPDIIKERQDFINRETGAKIPHIAHSSIDPQSLIGNIENPIGGTQMYTRFNFTTGDAAGQNMCGKAAFAACKWIEKNYPGKMRFTLSGAIDTSIGPSPCRL